MVNIKNTMLISPNTIKNYNVVNLNVDDSVLGNCIRTAQNIYLRDVIGTDLLTHLQELVYNKIIGSGSSIDDNENVMYKVLLDEYVKPTLSYRTAVECCTVLSLKLRNMGLVKNSDTNVNATTQDDIIAMKQYYDAFFNDSLNRMMEYLCENKGAFVELPEGFCTCSSKPLYGRTNLWLG